MFYLSLFTFALFRRKPDNPLEGYLAKHFEVQIPCHDNNPGIEAPRCKQRGIFDRKEVCYFWIRLLTTPQAAGNALAFAVQ
jgi:hypothetical protein